MEAKIKSGIFLTKSRVQAIDPPPSPEFLVRTTAFVNVAPNRQPRKGNCPVLSLIPIFTRPLIRETILLAAKLRKAYVFISISDPSHFDVDPDPGIHIW